jgi:hypothetical protein
MAKVEAERDKEIRELIEKLKPKIPKEYTLGFSDSTASYEGFNKPIEINLDACRNF